MGLASATSVIDNDRVTVKARIYKKRVCMVESVLTEQDLPDKIGRSSSFSATLPI